MDLHRLGVFCKVVELRSFTKAGEEMLLSQSTVSEHIRSLEGVLNEKLLDRLGREIFPTPAGKILYKYAQKMLQMREEAIQALATFKGELSGRLVLGASPDPGTYILPKITGTFKAAYPSIQIGLKVLCVADVVHAVVRGTLEVGLIGSKWKESRIDQEEIFTDELTLVVFPDHPWSNREEILMEELYGQPFILRERGSGSRMVMSEILEQHGLDFSRLKVAAEMVTTEGVRQSVRARIGIAILSKRAVAEDLERGALVALPLKGIQFIRPYYLIKRRHRESTPLCKAFVDHLRAESQV